MNCGLSIIAELYLRSQPDSLVSGGPTRLVIVAAFVSCTISRR